MLSLPKTSFATQLVRLSELSQDKVKRALAFRGLGSILMSRDDLAGAEAAFDQCLSTGGQTAQSSWIKVHGESPLLVAQQYKGCHPGASRSR
jgi:hypothetical protein